MILLNTTLPVAGFPKAIKKTAVSSTFVLLFILASLLTACELSLAADVTPPPDFKGNPPAESRAEVINEQLYPIVPPDASKGETVYIEKCAPCHGSTGLGNGSRASSLPNPVPAIGTPEIARRSTPTEWYTIVTEGNLERFMPPFESLSDRQRWDVVAYAYNLSADPESIANGQALYEVLCINCHGVSGKGDGDQNNTFSNPPPDFTDQEFMASKSAADFYQAVVEGVRLDMPSFEDQLIERERWALADYLRSFVFPPLYLLKAEGDNELFSQEIDPGDGTLLDSEPSIMGNVVGEVFNNSGGEVPSGLEVTLYGFEHDTPTLTTTTELESDGTYSFEDIDLPVGHIFFATVDYGGTRYASNMAVIEEGIEAIMLPIEVYDSTDDSSGLVVDRLHYFFELLEPETLRIVELYVISNPSNLTVVPDEDSQTTIAFELPEAASSLEILDSNIGERFVMTENGFADTFPIQPGEGENQVVFAYDLPYDGRLEFSRPVNLLTNAVVILIPEDGISVKGNDISDGGTRDVEGMPYHIYNGGGLLPGDEFSVMLSGKGTLSFLGITGDDNTNLLLGIGIFGIVLVAAGVWFYLRSKTKPEDKDETIEAQTDVGLNGIDNSETAMDAILALDDLYKEGQLPEEAYLERRAELKLHLKQLIEREAQEK